MTDPRSLAPGTTLADRYTVEMALSAPGRGPVYRALDTHLQRRVTLRAFPSMAGWDARERERFESDIRKATPLDHAHLAGIRDFGTDPAFDVGFLLYEPLYGMALGMFLARREASSPVTALQILHDVAEGVGASHWAGLVHGEIHPGTIFMAYGEVDRQVRVEMLSPGLPPSRWGGPGSADAAWYAAPEVLRGESAPTPASDVYSLGVVAYELLVGLPGRWDESVAGTLPRESIEIPPANEIRPEIPHDIAEAVAGALHPDPGQRFNDANTFALVLAHALDSSAMGPRMAAAFEGMPDFIRKDLPSATAEPTPTPTPSPTPSPSPSPSPTPPTADPAPAAATPGSRSPERSGRSRGALAAAAVVAVLAIGGAAWTFGHDPAPATGTGAPATQVAMEPQGMDGSGAESEPAAVDESTRAVEAEPGSMAAGTSPAGPDGSAVGERVADDPSQVDGATEPEDAPVEELEEPLEIEAPAPLAVAAPRVDMPDDPDAAGAAALQSLPALVDDAPEGSDAPDPSRVYGLSNVDEPPVLRNGDRLQRRLRRLATTGAGPTVGRVLLEFLVLPEGRVDTSTVAVLESSSRRLASAAREVMGLAEFDPGVIDGLSVRVLVKLELVLSADN